MLSNQDVKKIYLEIEVVVVITSNLSEFFPFAHMFSPRSTTYMGKKWEKKQWPFLQLLINKKAQLKATDALTQKFSGLTFFFFREWTKLNEMNNTVPLIAIFRKSFINRIFICFCFPVVGFNWHLRVVNRGEDKRPDRIILALEMQVLHGMTKWTLN